MTKWIAYYSIEPFGQWRDNYHAAIIASMVANYSGNTKQPRKPDEFMLVSEEVRRDRETRRTLATLDAMAKRK